LKYSQINLKNHKFPQLPRHFRKCLISANACDILQYTFNIFIQQWLNSMIISWYFSESNWEKDGTKLNTDAFKIWAQNLRITLIFSCRQRRFCDTNYDAIEYICQLTFLLIIIIIIYNYFYNQIKMSWFTISDVPRRICFKNLILTLRILFCFNWIFRICWKLKKILLIFELSF